MAKTQGRSGVNQLSLNVITNYLSSGVGIVLGFLVPPLALSYWKAEGYGVWTLITSLVAYLSVSGFGIETASAVLMSRAVTSKQKNAIFQKSVLLLGLSSILFCILLASTGTLFPQWIQVFGRIPPELLQDTRWAVVVYAFAFLINYPFAIVSSGLIGYQKQYLDNLFRMLYPVVGLLSLLVVIFIQGSLIDFAIFQASITLCLNFAKLLVYWFYVRKPDSELTVSTGQSNGTSLMQAREIIHSGWRYFIYGLSVLVVTNIDNFLISNLIDVASVTSYSLTARVFLMMNMVVTLLFASLAPILSKKFGENDTDWLKRAYFDLTRLALVLGGMICLAGVLFLDDFVVHFWVGPSGSVGSYVILPMAIYVFSGVITNISNIFLIQGNLTRGFIYVGWLEAILHVSLVLLLIPVAGVLGVALGQCVAIAISQLWLSPWLLRRNSRQMLLLDWKLVGRFSFGILTPAVIAGFLATLLIEDFLLRVAISMTVFVGYLAAGFRMLSGRFNPVSFLLDMKRRLGDSKPVP